MTLASHRPVPDPWAMVVYWAAGSIIVVLGLLILPVLGLSP